MTANKHITIGTRRSDLADRQARCVAKLLQRSQEPPHIEIIPFKTAGDHMLERSLSLVGGKSLFTHELDRAVCDGDVDMAVHSLKDMPAGPAPPHVLLAAFPQREDARDALLGQWTHLDDLPEGARMGGASIRRMAQVRAHRPDLRHILVRGNVPTRLRALDEGRVDAMILAAAGLKRLDLIQRAAALMPIETMPPAPGQGSIVVVISASAPPWLAHAVASIDHAPTRLAVIAERSFSMRLGGSCAVPLGAHCRANGQQTHMIGELLEADGPGRRRAEHHGPLLRSEREAEALGGRLADDINAQSATSGTS